MNRQRRRRTKQQQQQPNIIPNNNNSSSSNSNNNKKKKKKSIYHHYHLHHHGPPPPVFPTIAAARVPPPPQRQHQHEQQQQQHGLFSLTPLNNNTNHHHHQQKQQQTTNDINTTTINKIPSYNAWNNNYHPQLISPTNPALISPNHLQQQKQQQQQQQQQQQHLWNKYPYHNNNSIIIHHHHNNNNPRWNTYPQHGGDASFEGTIQPSFPHPQQQLERTNNHNITSKRNDIVVQSANKEKEEQIKDIKNERESLYEKEEEDEDEDFEEEEEAALSLQLTSKMTATTTAATETPIWAQNIVRLLREGRRKRSRGRKGKQRQQQQREEREEQPQQSKPPSSREEQLLCQDREQVSVSEPLEFSWNTFYMIKKAIDNKKRNDSNNYDDHKNDSNEISLSNYFGKNNSERDASENTNDKNSSSGGAGGRTTTTTMSFMFQNPKKVKRQEERQQQEEEPSFSSSSSSSYIPPGYEDFHPVVEDNDGVGGEVSNNDSECEEDEDEDEYEDNPVYFIEIKDVAAAVEQQQRNVGNSINGSNCRSNSSMVLLEDYYVMTSFYDNNQHRTVAKHNGDNNNTVDKNVDNYNHTVVEQQQQPQLVIKIMHSSRLLDILKENIEPSEEKTGKKESNGSPYDDNSDNKDDYYDCYDATRNAILQEVSLLLPHNVGMSSRNNENDSNSNENDKIDDDADKKNIDSATSSDSNNSTQSNNKDNASSLSLVLAVTLVTNHNNDKNNNYKEKGDNVYYDHGDLSNNDGDKIIKNKNGIVEEAKLNHPKKRQEEGMILLKFRRFKDGNYNNNNNNDPFCICYSDFFIGRNYNIVGEQQQEGNIIRTLTTKKESESKQNIEDKETFHDDNNNKNNGDITGNDNNKTTTSKEFLRMALLYSNKFIPNEKKYQWENKMPDCLIFVEPHQMLPDNTKNTETKRNENEGGEPFRRKSWFLNHSFQRSRYDCCYANLFLHCFPDEPSLQWILTEYLEPNAQEQINVQRELIGAHVNRILNETDYITKNGLPNKKNIRDQFLFGGEGGDSDVRNICKEIQGDQPQIANDANAKWNINNWNIVLTNGQRTLLRTARKYIERLLIALEMERLRCFNDLKKHDMYSIRWDAIEIAPPCSNSSSSFSLPESYCGRCSGNGNNGVVVVDGRSNQYHPKLCAYHEACELLEQKYNKRVDDEKPIKIQSKEELEMLPTILRKMRRCDNLIARFTVPGVAENYPLLSMGDLVRLRFTESGLSNEIIGQIVDVVTKTEMVTILLPPPFDRIAPPAVFPYLQAILSTKDRYIDARSIINKPPIDPSLRMNGNATAKSSSFAAAVATAISQDNKNSLVFNNYEEYPSEIIPESHRKHIGRFDIRFSFLGGRGFDMAERTLSYVLNQSNDVSIGKDENDHLTRVLVPTLGYTSFPKSVSIRGRQKHVITSWSTQINTAQKIAVSDIVFKNHGTSPYIIFGPAGTGKTRTVCEAVIQILRRSQRTGDKAKIMLCAPSDTACDVLASRLIGSLPPNSVMRINHWSRKLSSLPPVLLSCSFINNEGVFFIPYSAKKIIDASVVVCQCFVAEWIDAETSAEFKMPKHFTHLFIDETSQAMEIESLIPLMKVGKDCSIIFSGDPKQLSPSLHSPAAARMGLGISIQERLMKLPLYHENYREKCVMTNLVENYRSHDALLTVPSSLFYGGSLKCSAPTDITSPYADWGGLGDAHFPMLLFDVKDGKEDSKIDTPSFYNLAECDAIIDIIKSLMDSKKKEDSEGEDNKTRGVGKMNTGDICVITPFRAQVLALRAKLRLSGLGSINVGVVEDFQGQESSVVLISTVLTRTQTRWWSPSSKKISNIKNSRIEKNTIGSSSDNNNNGEVLVNDISSIVTEKLGFMHDSKRFNVAITRAQALCIVVGHAEYLHESGTYWTALIEHIKRNGGIISSSSDRSDKGNQSEVDDKNYGIQKLMEKVEELKLLGAGFEEDKSDLSFYYEDLPAWRVLLT